MNKALVSLFIFSSSLFSDIFPFQTIEKANSAYLKGKFIKSARLFEMLDVTDASVAYNIANAYYKAGDYDKALEYYIKAEGVDDSARFYNMGNSYYKKNNFNKAIDFYIKSLNVKDDIDTQHNLLLAEKRAEEKYQKKDSSKNINIKRDIEKKVEDKSNQDMGSQKELDYLLKQTNKKRIPTVMYSVEREEEHHVKNPW